MDSTNTPYATFPFEWTLKSTSYQIRYRKAENINEIDEIFCSIINVKGNEIEFQELGKLLGFNLQDLAELDIFNIYLKKLKDYNLITLENKVIQLSDFGQEALRSKVKYKYFYATTELFENQTALGEKFDFDFSSVFSLENQLSHEREVKKEIFDAPEIKQKLQFQLFENDIYNGEVIEIYDNNPNIKYKTIDFICESYALGKSLELSFFKSDLIKPDIQLLVDLPENEELKNELIRKGMFNHILIEKDSICTQDIEQYIDLWNWTELAENPKLDWSDKTIFKLFRENGDGSIWSIISEIAPIESIKTVIQEYAEYWNWTTLTERFDYDFIKLHFDNLKWDLEELSFKEFSLVQDLLIRQRDVHIKFWQNEIKNNLLGSDLIKALAADKNYDLKNLTNKKEDELVEILTFETLRTDGWDWKYLSKNLSNDYIESNIDVFPWDYYLISEEKSEILRNLFRKQGKDNYIDILLSKPWNWKFISKKFDETFLYKQLSSIAIKVDWYIILEKFFNNENITAKCLKDPSFKSLLIQYLPDNFVIAHQKYLWSINLIDFFEGLNLIQWETQRYINGFETNENVEWNKAVFQKYHNHITTDIGFLNVSRQVSDYSLIEQFSDFAWNWEGISQNQYFLKDPLFIKKAFTGDFHFSEKLQWSEILDTISNVGFINKYLNTFYETTRDIDNSLFWEKLTKIEEREFIFQNIKFPWDWSFITEESSEETILNSYEDNELFEKWDWEIATRKIEKDTILENLEDFAPYIDWKYLINEAFTVENELSMDSQLPRIAACLTVVNNDKRKENWADLTVKIPFSRLFPIVEATYQLDDFEWDWEYISNNEYFPTDIETINEFKNKINWEIFSKSKSIQRKFDFNQWEGFKDWFENTINYLDRFKNEWDWINLSKINDLNHSRLIIDRYIDKNWDWEYLSEFGSFLTKQKRDKKNYLERLLYQFGKIKFEILSRRKDIVIDSNLILEFRDKNWDLQVLSKNEKAEISIELVLELKNKNWDWQALSIREDVGLSNESLLKLLEKDWDWNQLSENENLIFNAQFIENTKNKPWDWQSVSRHKSFLPTVEILTLTKDFDLDWKHLSQHSSLTPTKELLAKFENKWNWYSITENPRVNFDDISFVERFADKLNWRYICEQGKINLNNQILSKFKRYLDWDLISSNTNLDFTKDIIQEFKLFWNWTKLKENKRVEELLCSYVADEINKNATLNFIDKIEQQNSQWKGNIYHFSHIDNAVEIIKDRKIQSRNKANIKGDAAGNVVHRKDDAHDYARFYFRPHTPTQFYNEFLGKNTTDGYSSKNNGWVSWYEKARGLGFPKCPIPIFFRFSLKEVLLNNSEHCCVSNGNMQTSSTQFGSIEKMISKFGFDDLYYTPQQFASKEDYNKYRNNAQQEFLIKDELTFDNLIDFEIICPSEADKTLLLNLLGNVHKEVFSKIVVDESYYNKENPRVRIEEEDSEIHISTHFNGDGYFVLNGGTGVSQIKILVGDVIKITKDKIIFKSNLSLGNVMQNIHLSFVDESNRKWFVFAK